MHPEVRSHLPAAKRDRARNGVPAVTQPKRKLDPTPPKRKLDPEQTYQLQVKVGATVVYDRMAFGDGCTLQVPGRDVEALLASGDVELVDPAER